MTIEQAISNAVAAEQAAARFYTRLSALARDEKTRTFLLDMADEEKDHARQIARWGTAYGNTTNGVEPDPRAVTVETAPAWEQAEVIDLEQALGLAIEAENNASLYYDALSDYFSGSTADFLKMLSDQELGHAQRLQELKGWLLDPDGQQPPV